MARTTWIRTGLCLLAVLVLLCMGLALAEERGLRSLAFLDLTAALKLGLEMTLEHLKNQGCEVSPQSAQALDCLK